MPTARWHVYLLRCGDGTLYTGVTTDVERRLEQHRLGKGARYTRGRGPLQLVHTEPVRGRSQAQVREAAWKRLPRAQKLALVSLLLSVPYQDAHGAARPVVRPQGGGGSANLFAEGNRRVPSNRLRA